MKKPWFIPSLILLILLLTWMLRWNYVATKTYGNGVAKWKIDRWTDYRWVEMYYTNDKRKLDSSEFPGYDNKSISDDAWKAREKATYIWYLLLGLDCLWFTIVLVKFPKRTEPNRPNITSDDSIFKS